MTCTPPSHTDEGSGEKAERVLFLMLFPLWGLDGNRIPQREIKKRAGWVRGVSGEGEGGNFPGVANAKSGDYRDQEGDANEGSGPGIGTLNAQDYIFLTST